jgi:hypothetical protein
MARRFLIHDPERLNAFSFIFFFLWWQLISISSAVWLGSTAVPEINKNVFHHFFLSK